MTKKQLLILLAAFVLIAGGLAAWLMLGDSRLCAHFTRARPLVHFDSPKETAVQQRLKLGKVH